MSAAEIANALQGVRPPEMRGTTIDDFAKGLTVVDDSYNSNPRSLISMVRTIAEAGGRTQAANRDRWRDA